MKHNKQLNLPEKVGYPPNISNQENQKWNKDYYILLKSHIS